MESRTLVFAVQNDKEHFEGFVLIRVRAERKGGRVLCNINVAKREALNQIPRRYKLYGKPFRLEEKMDLA